ncbi:tRNA (guanosine(46)-N7)-methyltransferase TrmB [soil metagenome]
MEKEPKPYHDAPRLPRADGVAVAAASIDVRTIVSGEWIELEIGPGRGNFLFERALSEPRAGLIGLEVRRKWAAIVDARLHKLGHAKRARTFAEDAKEALPALHPDASVRRVYLLFPDPWWKKRHQKRLVMGDVFLDAIARLLEPEGELFIETDVEERAEQYRGRIGEDARFVPFGDDAGSPMLRENPYGARTNREHRAIADGLPVHRMRWRRGTEAAPRSIDDRSIR